MSKMEPATPKTASEAQSVPGNVPQPPPQPRSSVAIQKGADRIMQLLESEQGVLTGLYHTALEGLEASYKSSQDNTNVKIRSIERVIDKRDKTISELQTDLRRTRDYALHVTAELDRLREEHRALQVSLSGVGFVSVDGRLQFDDDVSRVVGDFVKGAKIQQDVFASSRLGTEAGLVPPADDDKFLSGTIGPREFFNLLSELMEKGRQFAESLGRHLRQEVNLAETRSTNVNAPAHQGAAWVSSLQ